MVEFNIERIVKNNYVEDIYSTDDETFVLQIKRYYIPWMKNPWRIRIIDKQTGPVKQTFDLTCDVFGNHDVWEEHIQKGYDALYMYHDDLYKTHVFLSGRDSRWPCTWTARV